MLLVFTSVHTPRSFWSSLLLCGINVDLSESPVELQVKRNCESLCKSCQLFSYASSKNNVGLQIALQCVCWCERKTLSWRHLSIQMALVAWLQKPHTCSIVARQWFHFSCYVVWAFCAIMLVTIWSISCGSVANVSSQSLTSISFSSRSWLGKCAWWYRSVHLVPTVHSGYLSFVSGFSVSIVMVTSIAEF